MPSILECDRIVGSVYPYSLNFATLFASHLSSILALFFLKSLVKLLLHDERSSILNQVLLFHQLFHCHKCSYGQGSLPLLLYSSSFLSLFFSLPLLLSLSSPPSLFLETKMSSNQIIESFKSTLLR